ncbi:Clp protease ClpP [Vibrio vulnificus]|uniref:head maturation protease, ClpP-related n=2 Tax=Vibrio vulnificus TaxID=672 RepID=UPI0010234F72|nr:head maturation protease, ClpP-related [Vibrio vulnificus]ELH9434869.1 Clp protease ClpP [Vibrio vulnificus]RZP97192.1 Clp protease ClpP [Vibrio vulnificus]RZQ44339.1 Clp protease ClpP [Vibrio vulnificus]
MAKKTSKLKAQGSQSWYKLKASAEGVKLFLYGYIGEWEISASTMLYELSKHDGKDLTIHFHTDGGEVDEGMAIYAAIKDYPGKVTGIVDSVCASISSVVLMACKERYIRPTARLMIHQCHGAAYGTAAEMRARADEAETINNQMIELFASVSGKTEDDIRADIAESDCWLSASEAVEYGLCTGIYEQSDNPLEASNFNAPKLKHLKAFNAPDSLVAMWQDNGEDGEPTAPDSPTAEPSQSSPDKLTAENDDMPYEEFKKQEKQRKTGINQLFAKYPKAKKLKAECLEDMDCDIETARVKLLAFLEPQGDTPEGDNPQSPTPAGQQTALTASAAQSHLSNYFGARLKACSWDDNNPYRHMSATEALRAHAGYVGDTAATQMSKKKLVAHAFTNNTHSLGDIIETHVGALIINEVANLESWHAPLVTRQPMKFGTNDILIMNDLGKPGVKTEGGKFTQVKLKASGDTAVLSTLGYEIQVSRELIMSDKFDFITSQVQKAVRNCAQAPADSLIALLKNNPKLKDGKPLFSKALGNEVDGPIDPATLADMSGKMADAQTSEGNPLYLKPETYLTSNQRAKKASALMKAETIKDEPNEAYEAFSEVQGLADLAGVDVAYAFAHNDHVSFVEGYHEDADGVQVETKEDWKSDGATIRIYIDSVIQPVDRKGVMKQNITAAA